MNLLFQNKKPTHEAPTSCLTAYVCQTIDSTPSKYIDDSPWIIHPGRKAPLGPAPVPSGKTETSASAPFTLFSNRAGTPSKMATLRKTRLYQIIILHYSIIKITLCQGVYIKICLKS